MLICLKVGVKNSRTEMLANHPHPQEAQSLSKLNSSIFTCYSKIWIEIHIAQKGKKER